MSSLRYLTLAILLVAPFLSSCDREAQAPLRIASSPWPGYEPLYLAREIGYLPASLANIFELPSSDITLESFRNRSADIATLTLDETLELLQGGVKLRILVAMDISHGADAVMAKPGVKTLAGLKGRRIAVLNIPLGLYMLNRTLEAAKLGREDIEAVIAAETMHEQMYREGKADAFVTFEPAKTRLAALGAHALFDSSHIPDEIFDLMVVHEDVYLSSRDEVCEVARQWFRTLDYMKQEPDRAATLIAKRLGVSLQEYRKMTEGIRVPSRQDNLRLLAADTAGILPPAMKLNEVMLRESQLRQRVDIAGALAPDLETCFGGQGEK